jgi:class 3 adenylate cyclase
MCGAEVRRRDHVAESESLHGARRPAAPTEEAGPQRRRLTVLFADLSGFTTLTQQYEPEDVRLLVDSFLGIAREAVET